MGDFSLHSACKVQIGDLTVKYWKACVKVSQPHTKSYYKHTTECRSHFRKQC